MKRPVSSESRRVLARLKRQMGAQALNTLLEDIRAHDDAALLSPPPPGSDPTVSAVEALLAPFPHPSADKARLLKAHLETLVGRKLPIRARGLPGAVRALKAHLSEDDIRDGAFSLRVTLGQAQTSSAHRKDNPHG